MNKYHISFKGGPTCFLLVFYAILTQNLKYYFYAIFCACTFCLCLCYFLHFCNMFEPSFGVLFRDCWATLWPLDWDRTNTRDDWYKSFWCAFTCLMIDISFWCGHLSKIRLTDNSLIELRKQRLWFLVESFLQMSKYQSSPNHFLCEHHHNRIYEQNNIEIGEKDRDQLHKNFVNKVKSKFLGCPLTKYSFCKADIYVITYILIYMW